MANLSQQRRQRMLDFLQKVREKNKDDDDALVAIGEIENEITEKKYGLVWEEHSEEVEERMVEEVPVFTEVYDKEIALTDDGYNFLLEGDNLHSLHLLEKTHKEKIDVIYIDPPYNTGNKEFIYDDDRNGVGFDDAFRHSKWLSFMGRRLKLAKNLLSNSGFLFISIDDNEYSQLKLLCDSIFGEDGYVSTLHWKKKKQPSYLHGQVAGVMEYILVYCKNRYYADKLSLSSPSDSNTRVDNATNQISERSFKPGVRVKADTTFIKAGVYKNKTMATEFLDDIKVENGVAVNGFRAKARFRDSQDRIDLFCEEGVIFITKNYGFRRDKLKEELEKKKAITDLILDWGDNQDSDIELKEIFGDKPFSYPKPKLLIKNLIKSTGSNGIILDFFAGSGTTGQAVLELNKEDDGNRKFILCTNNENNICEGVTYPRLQTVITGVRQDGNKYSDGIPANLKYYKTDYVSKKSDNLSADLIKHIDEMIQLEYHVKIDKDKYISVLTDEDADELEKNWQNFPNIRAIYISRSVLLTGKQRELFETKDCFVIPDYYFREELRDAGEA